MLELGWPLTLLDAACYKGRNLTQTDLKEMVGTRAREEWRWEYSLQEGFDSAAHILLKTQIPLFCLPLADFMSSRSSVGPGAQLC